MNGAEGTAGVDNPPGRPALEWRAATHAASLARMRAALTADDRPPAIRALAQHDSGDPAIALLDGWATVADVVSFYTERIANEAYLRTATERTSLRELARTLGHELRPGVAARADLVFVVDDTPGAPDVAVVPRATPVQTVPGPAQMPQVFETSVELVARSAWNSIPGVPSVPQPFAATPGEPVWLTGTGHGLRAGDPVLLGAEEPAGVTLSTVAEVVEDPAGWPGWTRVALTPRDAQRPAPPGAGAPSIHAFDSRTYLFGWNAPDPTLLRGPGDSSPADDNGRWPDYEVLHGGFLELDGDHPEVRPGSWLAVEDLPPDDATSGAPTRVVPARATTVLPGGASRYALAGRVTRVVVDGDAALIDEFSRRSTVVHSGARLLPAGRAPRAAAVAGATIELAAVDPLLPLGRTVIVTGWPPGVVPPPPAPAGTPAPPPLVETARVLHATADPTGTVMTVVLDSRLENSYDPRNLRVHANVVEATHGETVEQVLGGGAGRTGFVRFPLRRGPLTYLRATTASGVRSSLEVRVDGVLWSEVEALADASGDDRVVTVREEEDGTASVTFGDGIHGARVPSGWENVTATYRVGIGPDGAAEAGQLSMPVRRPFGIRSVTNPAPASDWAPRETVDQARIAAPIRVRTLDRIVSVADHGDLAQGFAGVGAATATAVWDGRRHLVAVTVLGVDGTTVSDELIADLRTAMDGARDPSAPLEITAATVLAFGTRFAMRTDPAYWRPEVEDDVRARLAAVFGPGRWGIAAAVTGARVLVAARSVPGVLAVTMPELVPVDDDGAPTGPPVARIEARPARWEGGLAPAQTVALHDAATTIATML